MNKNKNYIFFKLQKDIGKQERRKNCSNYFTKLSKDEKVDRFTTSPCNKGGQRREKGEIQMQGQLLWVAGEEWSHKYSRKRSNRP